MICSGVIQFSTYNSLHSIPFYRRDKYEPTIKEYWVDVQTTGSYDDENEESLVDVTMARGDASSFSLGLPEPDPKEASRSGEDQPEADTDQDTDEDVDDGDGASTRSKGRIPNRNEVQKEHALEAGFKCIM